MGILSLIPIKDWIYGGLIAAILIFGGIAWHRHNVHEQQLGAQRIETAVSAERVRAEQQNAKDNAARKTADDAQVAKDKADYEKRLSDSNALVASLNARLRSLTAASNSGKAPLPGNPAASAGTNDASGISASVESALEGVIGAAGRDGDKVTALQAYINNVCLAPQ